MTATKYLRVCFLVSLLIVPLVLLPTPASAQFNSAIQGTVTDAQKGVLAGATVKVTNIATGQARETVTSADGLYTVVSLAVGTYRVEVELDGFQKGVHEVSVGISETARGDFVLEVSSVTESVTVAGASALVETTQGRISGRVDRTQLQEMPLNGRNLYNLIALQPGVTGKGVSSTFGAGGNGNDSFSGESAPRINAGGQRDEANSFTLDDTSTNGVARGGITNLTPNAESVEEIRVVANNFSAVDGRNSGAQIQVISKGGTNTFRGSASFYYQDENFTTKNVFETAVPEFSKKQFGYSFGGPIVRNRLFFFTSYEGLRQAGGRGSSFTVETPEYRDFVARTYPNSIAANLFANYQPGAYPTSTFRDTGSPVPGGSPSTVGAADGIMDIGAAFYIPDVWRDGDQFNVRTDYELRPGTDRLYANFYRTTSLTNNGGIRPYFDYPVKETTLLRQPEPHPRLQRHEAERVPRRHDAADRPAPGSPRDTWHPRDHDHRHLGLRGHELPARVGPDELALQEHLHGGPGRAHHEDGWRTAPDVRLGREHDELHPGVPVLQHPQLRRRYRSPDESLRRSAVRPARDGLLGARPDGVGALLERRLAAEREADDQRRRALRELRDVRRSRGDPPQPDHERQRQLQRTAGGGESGHRRPLLRARQQQPCAASRVRVGSEGRREDVGPRRLRDRVRPPDEPARRELPAQPATARPGLPRPGVRHRLHLQLGRPEPAELRLPRRSGAADGPRRAQRRAGRPRVPHDRRHRPASRPTPTPGSSACSGRSCGTSSSTRTTSGPWAATCTTPTT